MQAFKTTQLSTKISIRTLMRSFSTERAFNFSAGPGCLPTEVMKEAEADFSNWKGTGMGIMEMSHRDVGAPVQASITSATQGLRDLLAVPDNYHIIFQQGGAHGQFAAVPLNLLGNKSRASYVDTGYWSTRAIDEAAKYGAVTSAARAEDNGYTAIPDPATWAYSGDDAYIHVCANETIHGLELRADPDMPSDAPPLVADMTSTLLSRPVDIAKYGCVYASGGKNVGPAGITVVIVRDDLLERVSPLCPSVLDWGKSAHSSPIPSVYNTPPTFLMYMADLVYKHYASLGGLPALDARADDASGRLYSIVDSSGGFYHNRVLPQHRSRMNVPFRIMGGEGVAEDGTNPSLEARFTQEAAEAGMTQLFGHFLFGGMRVTLYNGLPDAAVDCVEQFMKDFMARHA